MSIENKTNFECWSHSFFDETTYPLWWKKEYGPHIELWLMKRSGNVRLYMTKEHIIHKINEDIYGRLPVWHVWNLRTDKCVFSGQRQREAYAMYRKEVEKEKRHDQN